MKLAKRTPKFSRTRPDYHPAMRAFHKPQREHVKGPVPPKPRCGMCGGKIHTRTDYRAPDEGREFPYNRRGDAGWWLCKSCDTGPEVGMPRAA